MRMRFPILLTMCLILNFLVLQIQNYFEISYFMNFFYVVMIISLACVLIMGALSTLAFSIGKFEKYWLSVYPVAFGIFLIVYGLMKTSSELMGILSLILGGALGYLVAKLTFKKMQFRVIPLCIYIFLIVLGQYSSSKVNSYFYYQIILPMLFSFFGMELIVTSFLAKKAL